MMEFGLLQPQNTSERVWNAFGQGQKMGQEMATQKAMGALAGNPDDPKAMQRLIEVNPEMGMRFQQQKQQQVQQELERRRGDIVKGAQIFRQFGVKDEATYQQARNAAQQMGIDVSEVPPNYDPAYVNGVVQIADTFEPQKEERGQMVPYVPGGGVARWNPQTNQMETVIMPNPGGYTPGAPVQGQGSPPPVLTDDQIRAMEQGGPTASPSGGFL